jgi:hypothetical protein
MAFQKHMRGIVANLGLGISKIANTGGTFTAVRYTDVWSNPPVVPTSEGATCTLVTTVAANNDVAGIDLTIVAGVEALLRTTPRNLCIWASAGQTEILSVTGTDQFGAAQTEDITFNGNAAVSGTKVWGSITKIHQAQRSGAANIGVGFGSLFGTSRRVLGLGLDGSVYVTATGITATVQETTRPVKSTTTAVQAVTFSTAIVATNTYVLSYLSDEAR